MLNLKILRFGAASVHSGSFSTEITYKDLSVAPTHTHNSTELDIGQTGIDYSVSVDSTVAINNKVKTTNKTNA